MRFLIKVAFWLGIVVLLLPSSQSRDAASGSQVGALEALSAAGAAVADMRQFCTRRPDVCTVGSQAAIALGQKAQAGAKTIYQALTERDHAASPAAESAGATSEPGDKASQNSLTLADRTPAWRGP